MFDNMLATILQNCFYTKLSRRIQKCHIRVGNTMEVIDTLEKESQSRKNFRGVYFKYVINLITQKLHFTNFVTFNFSIVAVKCNDTRPVLEILAALGAGFDCASKGEIARVLSYGVCPDAIIYAHPMKQISHLNFAAEMNVKVMTVDSDFELHKIAKYYPSAR